MKSYTLWLKIFFSEVDHFLRSLLNWLLNVVLFLFYVLIFFGHEACGILAL